MPSRLLVNSFRHTLKPRPMRTSILLSAVLLSTLPAAAQLNAGDVPAGYSAWDPGIDLQLSTAFTSDSAFIDLDCDGHPEILVMLWQGEPAVDAPNLCTVQLLDTALALCADGSLFDWRPQYHAFGASLECTGNYLWRSDAITWLGSFGGFLPSEPATVDSQYMAYRHGSEIGWILLSFNMAPNGGMGAPISVQVHQVLRPCLAQSVGSLSTVEPLTLFPNPSHGADIRIESTDALRSIEVLAPTGQLLARYTGNVRSIPAPEAAGIYFLRAQHNDGQWSVSRFVLE